MGTILVLTGVVTTVLATWRGYAAARAAVGPLVHDGEPTRTALEAVQPLLARHRVRRFARQVAVAVGWLLVAGYGLFLASVGMSD